MEATNGSLLLNIALVLAISTAQRIFAIKIRRTKNHAAISQDYLLGGARALQHASGKFNGVAMEAIAHVVIPSASVGIQRSEMRLRLDLHVATSLLVAMT